MAVSLLGDVADLAGDWQGFFRAIPTRRKNTPLKFGRATVLKSAGGYSGTFTTSFVGRFPNPLPGSMVVDCKD